MIDERRWYAGVDWATESHHVFLTDENGRRIGEKIFRHSGEGLAEMAVWLSSTSGGVPAQIHIAIEVPRGPVVETLIERGFKVHAINPKQMDRFRDRFTLAGAKDDSRDAEVMASALRTDLRCFRPLAVADPVVIELREWSRIANDLGAERNRLTNRMREQLWRYFPAMLDLESDLGAEWLLDLWEIAPTPHKAIRVREATVAKVLKRNRIRRFDAAHVLDVLRKPPVQVAAGTTEAAAAHIKTLTARIRLVNHQLGSMDESACPPSEEQARVDRPRLRSQTLIDSENGNLSGGDFRRPQDFDKTGGDSDPLRLASPICDDAATDGASDFLAP
jgi:transposase